PKVTAALPICSVVPGATIVRPAPPIVPMFQKEFFRNVKRPLPERVGELFPSPSVRLPHSAVPLTVIVAVLVIKTLSLEPGTKFGLQFVATSQSPFPAVHIKSYEIR